MRRFRSSLGNSTRPEFCRPAIEHKRANHRLLLGCQLTSRHGREKLFLFSQVIVLQLIPRSIPVAYAGAG